MKKNYKLRSRIALIAAVFTMAFNASAQTTLINPATDGGFENGSTFSANGWSSSNSANNPWVIGTAVSSGAITGNSAYISNDAGVTNAYTPANNSTNYFWRDITVPAGEAKIILTFNWRSEGEASWDNMQVFTAPTTITPVGVATHPGSGTTNVPAGIAGATNIGFYQMGGAATVNSASIQLSPSLAGTTFRLIFSWKNETGGAQPPASIDNISLTSSLPGNFISITTGNWSAPATWQANAVPTSADNVIISSGDIVTLDLAGQAAYNATVNGTLNFGTVPTVFTVNQNLIVNTGGTLNAFNGTTGKNLTVTGNITNDGTIDLSKGTSTTTSVLTLNGSAVQTVSGTGTFTTNVIRNLTFNNSSNAIPNINWLFNNISIAANLTFTSGKVNLSTNKITLGTGTTSGTGANSVGALTAPVGQGFMPGGTFSRWYTTASTGTSITAGTDPTNATSRYPFLNSAAQNRAMYITRAASGTAGGQLSVKYNDGTGMSPVSFMDGTYNIDKIYNGNWVVSTEGTGITSASYGAYLIGQAAYTAANGNSRIVSNTAAISGTNQLGTTTPAGYRTGISLADLTNPSGLYLGISNADLLFPCAGTPTAGTVSGTATVCAGAPFTLSLTGASSGETGLTYQWQSSADGMTYSNIAGATTTSYTAPLIIAPTYYQVVVTCTNSSSSATTPSFLVGFTHSVTSISPASRCGTGAVTLGATGSAGTNLVWYSASAGGSYLGTGSTFTTPVINATTSYYVGAGTVSTGTASLGNGGTTGTSAAYNFTNGTYGGMKTQLLYTAAELTLAGIAPGNITTIAFDFTSVGSTLNGFNIQMGSSSLTTFGTPVNIVGGLSTVYTAATMTPVIGTNSFTLSTPFNWDGSSNILVSISWSNNNASNTSSTIKYDATTNYSSQSYRKDNETAVNMLGFTGSTGAGTSTFDRSTNRPRITFGAQIQCTSPLSEVVATVNTPPSLTMSATPSTICAGESSSLNVSSSNGGYAYTWTPGGLSGATHSVTPASTTTYTVTAMDNSGGANDGCATTATVTVNVNPLPTPPVTATPSVICSGGSSQLLAGSVPSAYCTPAMATVEAGGDFLNNFTFANITNLNSGDAATDYTYYNSLTANVLGGSTYSLSLEAGGTASLYAQQFRIWIDYNQNGVFEASESVFNTSTSSFSPTVVSGSVVIPMSAYNGITRMRVASRYSTTPLVSESCLGAGTYGEFEDYNVNISGGRDLPTYSWSPGTFLSSTTIQNPLASAMTATTTYTVNVTEGVCSASQTVTVTVNPLPTVTAASNDTDNTVCAGTSLTLNGGGASTYTWTGSVVNNTAFNPVSSNTYTVTGTDVNNCSSTASITVSVNSLPSVMAMSTASTVCAGTSVTLSGMGSATSYTW
ncbi:MAG: Protein of unknown function precursor, partial [Bacteroidetes bacterium]|nr:Protein of unknown function precursor [Bacteroidota bacterium]